MTIDAGSGIARVWDMPVRLFHWLLVALFGVSWWSGKQHAMEWHRLSGYVILALLLFRIYWGFVGGRTARFAHFVRGALAGFAYARTLGQGPYAVSEGHNPLGGWSVVMMLAALLTMVVAGLFSVDVDGLESGPLADYVSFDQGRVAAQIHGIVFNVLLTMIALHVVAILFYLLRHRHDLITPMITGRRRGAPVAPLAASLWKAALGIVLAAAIAWAAARGFRF
jgi:cytochrome b